MGQSFIERSPLLRGETILAWDSPLQRGVQYSEVKTILAWESFTEEVERPSFRGSTI
jgi:hypothetical protein